MLTLGALNWSLEWYRPGRRSPSEIASHAATIFLDAIASIPETSKRGTGSVSRRGMEDQ